MMHSETIDRIKQIRSKVLAGKASVADLDAQISDNYMKQLLQRASNYLDDVEGQWLGIVLHERIPPRSLVEELQIVGHAEFFLERIALPQLKAVQELVAKFGPNIQSIG